MLPANAPIRQFLNVPLQRPAGGEAPGPSGAPARLHLQRERRQRRRSRRRRRVRDRPQVGSVERARHRVARRLRPRDPRRLQAGRHAALADRSRPEHPRRRALHAVHRLRPRRRRPRRSGVQDGRRNRSTAGARSSATRRRTIAPWSNRPTACAWRARPTRGSARSSRARVLHDLRRPAPAPRCATTDYIPGREPQDGWGGIGGNGGSDNNGNRVDRFLAGVAYLDGRLPSVLMARGYYGRSVIAAWDWRGGEADVALGLRFRQRAAAVSEPGRVSVFGPGQSQPRGRRRGRRRPGRDRLRIDGRRRQRQGTVLDRPASRRRAARRRSRSRASGPRGVRHPRERRGDRRRSARRGWRCTTRAPARSSGACCRAATSAAGWRPTSIRATRAPSSGPSAPAGLLDVRGQRISDAPRSVNFAVWWDADPLREILDANWIAKWDPATAVARPPADGRRRRRPTTASKATPALSADLFGDWREEVIWRSADNTSLRIYTTTIPADQPPRTR